MKSLPESAKSEIGEFLVEQILASVQSRRSPVNGEKFQPLVSKEYKEEKRDAGLSAVPDLQLTGKMLDELDFRVTSEGVKIGVFGDAAERADGHNNLSGASKLPTRQFIPKEGEGFVSSIEKEIDRIIADTIAEQATPDRVFSTLRSVSSSAALYETLGQVFPLESRSEIRLAVLRSEAWVATLRGLGLIKWL